MSDIEQRIRILPPEEARKIAAGEVIDRPSALVREFLDNAIDAGSRHIEVTIEDGGIGATEVSDDGSGMSREDLELCWQTHATSKIRSLDDLRSIGSLGFRGEALAAAAAVSRLEILTSRDGREAWKLSVGPGGKNPPYTAQSLRTRGTSVRALGLYDTIPARKRFLKRPGSEAASCRQIFNEKAMAFPDIAFRFIQDGTMKIFLPPAASLKERFIQIFLEEREGIFLHEIAAGGQDFSVSILVGGPELSRGDRRLQFVFANSRRIQDYALLQALEYGVQGLFPNASHPLGAVFVTINPALADFNIHPAKREVRFADPPAIHHTVTAALRDFCRFTLLQNSARKNVPGSGMEAEEKDTPFENQYLPFASTWPSREKHSEKSSSGPLAMEALLSKHDRGADFTAEAEAPYPNPTSRPENGKARYLGHLFGLFILVEKDDRLFIIDQHAAHERILYNRFMEGSIPKQNLLVAIPFTTESPEDDNFLEEKRKELARLGIVIRKTESGWLVEALPSLWDLPDSETVEDILNLKTAGENMVEHWAATLSCRKAIRDGDFLDEKTALALAEEAFALPVHLCPHGRPIWFEVSRRDLLKAVKRL